MGKQHQQQGIQQHLDSDYDDDFESDLILPDGPLSLRLSAKDRAAQDTAQAHAQGSTHSGQQRRPHTSNSDIESTTSGSSSHIFSTCSSDSATSQSESEDSQHRGPSRLRARITSTHGRLDDDDSEENDGFDDDEDDDEKSNTIKANQLPEDFAQQLALSKAQAALAKAKGSSASSSGGAPHSAIQGQSSTQNTHADWEDDLVFTSKESLNASRILHKKSSFASHISESGSVHSHSRSTTSHSQSSSNNNKTTSSSNEDDEDFFDDLEVPSYFVPKARHEEMYNTPPSSVESKTSSFSRKADLQSLLNQKLKARVGLHDQFTNAALQPSTSTLNSEPMALRNENATGSTQQKEKKTTASPKHVEKQDERFEDSFVFDDLPSPLPSYSPKVAIAKSATRPSLPSSSSSRSLMSIPPSRSTERLSPLPAVNALSSRSSSIRSSITIRPSRSSLNLNEGPGKMPTAEGSSTSRNMSSLGHAAGSNIISSGLRARPSLSNLSGISASHSASTATARPPILARKASHNALNESSRTFMSTNMQDRPSSSMAHYAQPTRASLARHHHLPFATITRSDSFNSSRPSTPLASLSQVLHSDSRTALTSSPSTGNMGAFSRLTRPTIASTAKSHKVTGSDPSGRTSASLGMPITSNPSSPLKSMKILRSDSTASSSARFTLYKQPRRTQTLGDGSELDGIDDLPVNREKEKRFVKIPMRRRQSSGVASVDSLQSAATTATTTATTIGTRSGQMSQGTASRRERVDSAPVQLQSAVKKLYAGTARASSSRAGVKTEDSSAHLTVENVKAAKSAKRPGLKLIRNLSASGLSRVQGQMRWNPVLLKWEGNESSLRDFDNVIASSARPALISPMGPLSPRHVYSKSPLANLPGSTNSSQNTNSNSIEQKILSISNPHGTTPSLGGVRIVGDMIFDPVKRSWFSTSSEGEEEINFGDDEDDEFNDADSGSKSRKVDAWEGGEQARLRTRRSFANDWSSNASSTGDDGDSDWNVAEFSRKQMEAEKKHEVEMMPWNLLKGVQSLQKQRAVDVRQFLHKF